MHGYLWCVVWYQKYIRRKRERERICCCIALCKQTQNAVLYPQTSPLLQPPLVAKYNKGGTVVTHLDAVTIASAGTYGQVDLCTLQRVFAQGNTQQDTLSLLMYSWLYAQYSKLQVATAHMAPPMQVTCQWKQGDLVCSGGLLNRLCSVFCQIWSSCNQIQECISMVTVTTTTQPYRF